MTEPALFTRTTLVLMRREAYRGVRGVAQLLNWSDERTARVGKAHGVEFGPALVEATIAIPVAPPIKIPPLNGSATEPVALRPLPPSQRKIIRLDATHNVVIFRGVESEKLSERQWLVINVLFRARKPRRGREIADRTGMPQNSLGAAIGDLRAKLEPLGLGIDSNMGMNGGYQLALLDGASE